MTHRSIIVIITMLIVIACKNKNVTVKPEYRNISESVYASGIVKGAFQYQVMSVMSGRIAEIYVKSGDTIRKGDPLFRIEQETAKIATDIARINAENADFNANIKKMEDAKINIVQLAQKMALDSALYKRQANLWSQNIGTKSELEQRELLYNQSSTNLQSAKIQLQELERQLRFQSTQARKNLDVSRLNEKELIIKSEINGMMYSVLKEKGEIVLPQTILGVAGSLTDFEMELQVDENDIIEIQPGLPVLIAMDSYKNRVFKGKILRIDPIMDERTRTFNVYARFDDNPPRLFANLTLEANIVLQSKENVLTVPRSVLIGDTAVMMKDNTMRQVKTGLKDYKIAEIISGLNEQDDIQVPVKSR